MSYQLTQNDPVTILEELNTGKSKSDSSLHQLDVALTRDSDRSNAVFLKLQVLPPPVKSHQFHHNGALVNVKCKYNENSREADFHFLTDIPGRNEDQYFYIHARNGRRIIRYMSGRVEID